MQLARLSVFDQQLGLALQAHGKKKLDLRVIGSANISLDDFYSFDDFIST